jgi:hypothetical protein
MRYGWATYDERTIADLLKQGRGSGVGIGYKPWITVRDISSLGLSSRTKGWKTKRVHHVLSKLEHTSFFCFEWSPVITDIREQFPLSLDETLYIAKELGIPHPKHPHHGTPVVLTTDFLLTLSRQGTAYEEARTTKYAHELASRRTLEKFEIERTYWSRRNVSWGIVTERDISVTLAHNVESIHQERFYPTYSHLTPEECADVATHLTQRVQSISKPLHSITSECDRTIGLKLGTALSVAKYLIATRQWLIDMTTPIDPQKALSLQKVCLDK